MAPTVKLIHWHPAEARALAARLQHDGLKIDAALPSPPVLLSALRRHPPAAVVISLDRLPSRGRDLAFGLRAQRATRAVPLLFAGGAAAKVAAVRARLPDAGFASWPEAPATLRRMVATTPAPTAAAPAGGVMAGYSGTPLPKKLGIKPDMHVALLGAPPGVAAKLGTLPAGATLAPRAIGATGLTLWFVRDRRAFARGLPQAVRLGDRMPVWVVSPKKSGALASDISQNDIRDACLDAGLVDYKVCAVDAAWSGLLFTRRGRTAARNQ